MKTMYGVSREGEHLFPIYATREEAQARVEQERGLFAQAQAEGWVEPGAKEPWFNICQTTTRNWR